VPRLQKINRLSTLIIFLPVASRRARPSHFRSEPEETAAFGYPRERFF
jgi:hypothetical protein